jgi:hypothetical protein
MRRLFLVAVGVVVGLGCGTTPPAMVCVPGKSEACIGPGNCAGGQQCNAAGTGFGACDCGGQNTNDAGTGSDAGTASDAGLVDAGVVVDAGLPTCNPSPADGGVTGCATGQRCTWVTLSIAPSTGVTTCVANGPSQLGATCIQGTPGLATGADSCVAGTVCLNDKCRKLCAASDPNSCGVDACVTYAGVFANDAETPTTGACAEGCNPITQLTTSGASCGSNKGCYLLTSQTSTISVCASAGTIGHGQLITGAAYANVCVPGASPRRKAGTQDLECGGLCIPNEVTSTLNAADEGGVAPDSCAAKWGASPPNNGSTGESCRYLWAREVFEPHSRFGNVFGFCFQHAASQYDSNGDQTPDAPFPRCTALTTGDVLPPVANPAGNDALEFWCLPYPTRKRAEPVNAQRLSSPMRPSLTGWR